MKPKSPCSARQPLWGEWRVGWPGALLRVLVVYCPAHRLPDRPHHRRLRLWQRVAADLDPDRFRVRQVSYPSRDGTSISMFLVHQVEVERTADNPTYLTGYGGFNISMTPAFSRSLLLWLERGGVRGDPQHSGRGGVRRGLAPGRNAGQEAEQLRRLHRRGRVADPRGLYQTRSGLPPPAAPTADFWWEPC